MFTFGMIHEHLLILSTFLCICICMLFTPSQSPPSCMRGVRDGLSWIDKDFQNQLLHLDVNFESLMDTESPLQEILIAVFQEFHGEKSVDENQRQISGWINAGAVTKASVFFSSPLEVGQKYFVLVKAQNAAGHVTTCESDGVRIDTTPPSAGNVTIMHGSAQAVDVRSRFLLVSFEGFHDTESGIEVFVWLQSSS